MDVKNSFLNGFIKEEMYVRQPPGFEDHTLPDHVFKLQKALYGLKQILHAWYDRLSSFLLRNGFMRGKVDTTFFKREVGKDFIIVQIYVDDIIFRATNESLFNDFSDLMKNEFEMSMMGELKFFLGLQIKQENKGIYTHQQKYTEELLMKFKMEDVKPMKTSMCASNPLSKDESGKPIDQKIYKCMIESLLYLTSSRLDIMHSVCLCTRFQSNPQESHLKTVNRILCYLVH